MVDFDRYQLNNGLTIILHHDSTTPMVVVNVLYDVGARDEQDQKTGFAHLFEHLMFGGSINIPEFDTELQKAGGESNAFTSLFKQANDTYSNIYFAIYLYRGAKPPLTTGLQNVC